MFAVKFFVTFSFCNFNRKWHKSISQKGLTFLRKCINVAKIAIIHQFAKINIAKNIKNVISLHCWKKIKNQSNKRSVRSIFD